MNTSRICIVYLLAGFLFSISQTSAGFSFGNSGQPPDNSRTVDNRPWGNVGAFKPAPKYERQPPVNSPDYYLGAAPGSGWPVVQNPRSPYGAQAPAAAGLPHVEVEMGSKWPYEQQNVIYTVRVISSENLKTLDAVLPAIDGALLEKIDGPVASSRKDKRSGKQEIINEYRFMLTPLRSGEITVPEIRFKGSLASGNQRRGMRGMPRSAGAESFTIASDAPLKLRVQPADPSVHPWLPLHSLKLQSNLQQEHAVKEGTPVTLVLEMTAKGALGSQLPSLEKQLSSPDYRVYRDSVSVNNGVSNDGHNLIGSRKETYTLIPLKNGWIDLPSIKVAWWDVAADAPRVAEVVGYDSEGPVQTALPSRRSGEGSSYPVFFWFPLMITLGLVLGYWLGAWSRTRPLLDWLGHKAGAALQVLKRHATKHTLSVQRKLSPFTYLNKLRMGLAAIMPIRAKVWMCTRCVQREDDPDAWCQEFKNRICQHLNITAQTPLPVIAEKLIEANPQVDPVRMRDLIRSLDGAIYGSRPIDFQSWKKDFGNQLRPRAHLRRYRRYRQLQSSLPELNPRSA
jgi:hypothetical protein